ncbi:hypothetical protein F2Q70_00029538 [Brassica cretica]|uniref:Uncharacterized protein n=1 Tax=Brassica cretica TaxID=69181 RepID=A0A8S9FQ62_BRACR|nr:hypothetical protein F2Q70_00029538 [Brassica cretica]
MAHSDSPSGDESPPTEALQQQQLSQTPYRKEWLSKTPFRRHERATRRYRRHLSSLIWKLGRSSHDSSQAAVRHLSKSRSREHDRYKRGPYPNSRRFRSHNYPGARRA